MAWVRSRRSRFCRGPDREERAAGHSIWMRRGRPWWQPCREAAAERAPIQHTARGKPGCQIFRVLAGERAQARVPLEANCRQLPFASGVPTCTNTISGPFCATSAITSNRACRELTRWSSLSSTTCKGGRGEQARREGATAGAEQGGPGVISEPGLPCHHAEETAEIAHKLRGLLGCAESQQRAARLWRGAPEVCRQFCLKFSQPAKR